MVKRKDFSRILRSSLVKQSPSRFKTRGKIGFKSRLKIQFKSEPIGVPRTFTNYRRRENSWNGNDDWYRRSRSQIGFLLPSNGWPGTEIKIPKHLLSFVDSPPRILAGQRLASAKLIETRHGLRRQSRLDWDEFGRQSAGDYHRPGHVNGPGLVSMGQGPPPIPPTEGSLSNYDAKPQGRLHLQRKLHHKI